MNPFVRVLVLLGLQRDPTQMSPEDRVLETYFDKLTVFPVAKTRVLTIEFTSRNPELSAKAANTIAELYIAAQEDAKKNNAKGAAGWLAKAIADLRIKVAQAESKVDDFRSNSGLFIGTNNVNIPSQQLAELNTQLATARAAQAEAFAKSKRLAELVRQGRLFEVSDVAKDDLIRRIGEQRVTLKAQLALESRTLLPGHPRIKELSAQIADIENEMRAAAEKTARALENDAKVASARVESIQAAFETQKKAVTSSNSEDVTLRGYERDARAARDQLESFLLKYREATARDAENASPADARIISRAVSPQLPSFPKKIPMLLISGLGALFLSLGLVAARALLSGEALMAPSLKKSDRMPESETAPAEVNAAAADAMAVSIPPAVKANPFAPRKAETQPDSGADLHSATSLAHKLRVAHSALAGEGRALCVLVSGLERGCGASSHAIALARILARDTRTILVDVDAAQPGLDALVPGDEAGGVAAGLSDLLSSGASFADVIHGDANSRLHVLPAGSDAEPAPDNSLESVLAALRETYDFVLLDAAPQAEDPSLLSLATLADIVVVIAPAADAFNVRLADTLVEFEGAGIRDTLVLRVNEPRAATQSAAA